MFRCTLQSDGNAFGGTEEEPLTIYAVNGFLDLNITGNIMGNMSIGMGNGMMYCTEDYSQSCNIESNEWICEVDGPSICNTGTAELVQFNVTISTIDSQHCNHSQPLCMEIAFDYLVDHDLGVSKDGLDAIIYNITTNFVEAQMPGVSECSMDHHDVIHSDFLSAVICYQCKVIDVLDVNVSQNLNVLSESFASTFHHGTDRLMLINGSTDIELTVNVPVLSEEEEENGSETVFESGGLSPNTGFDPTRIEFAMVCAVIFALIMTLCWMRYMLQRKPKLSPKHRVSPADLNVNYLRSKNRSRDDSSLSADSGSSKSPSRSKQSNGSNRSKASVGTASEESSGSKGSKDSTKSGGSTETSKDNKQSNKESKVSQGKEDNV